VWIFLHFLFVPFSQELDKYYVCNEKLGCDSAIKTKHVALEIAPKLLSVHLKRYVQLKKGTTWVENKLGHHVAFPDVLRVPVVSLPTDTDSRPTLTPQLSRM
jgi:hypothetical protein